VSLPGSCSQLTALPEARRLTESSGNPSTAFSVKLLGLTDSVSEFLTTLLTKKSSLVMMDSTNRGELMYSRLVTPFAKAAFRNAVNRDGLAKCLIQFVFPPLLRR